MVTSNVKPEGRKERYQKLLAQLERERASWMPQWRDLADFILPHREMFLVSESKRGDRRNLKIVDNTATWAADVLTAGLMSGFTNPAKRWFGLSTQDPDLAKVHAVRLWLDDVNERMFGVFGRSNLYDSLPLVYADLGVFATAAILVEEDFESVLQTHVFPIGSYYLANGDRDRVRVFFREFRLTARQIVEKFGHFGPDAQVADWSNISKEVREAYENGQTEQAFDLCHVIEPNPEYDPRRQDAAHKRYRSAYYEKGRSTAAAKTYGVEDDVFLRVSGYDYFPVLAPRWKVRSGDSYGTFSPGMNALGDVKQLQHGEKKSAQALDKIIDPPLKGPPEARGTVISMLAGGVTLLSEREGQKGLSPLHEVNPGVAAWEEKQAQIRSRIERAFHVPLFLAIQSLEKSGITAREIEARVTEGMVQIGPVFQRVIGDLLDPLIDLTFDFMAKQGLIPEPPEELAGQPLKIEYVSPMAVAQKAVSRNSILDFATFVGEIAGFQPEILDKVDLDRTVDVYGGITNVPPAILRSADDVAAIRQARARAQAAQQQAALAREGAAAAKDLASADTGGQNALTQLLRLAQPAA